MSGKSESIGDICVRPNIFWMEQGLSPRARAYLMLTYVRDDEDLEPHRTMAETLITSWEKRDRNELNDDPSRN